MLFPACSRRSLLAAAALASTVAMVIGLVAAPHAGANPPSTFVTMVRVDCGRGFDAVVFVTLTRDSTPIGQTTVFCGFTGTDTNRAEVVTAQEPNDWEWDAVAHENGNTHGCSNSGTQFPARDSVCEGLATLLISKPHPGS